MPSRVEFTSEYVIIGCQTSTLQFLMKLLQLVKLKRHTSHDNFTLFFRTGDQPLFHKGFGMLLNFINNPVDSSN